MRLFLLLFSCIFPASIYAHNEKLVHVLNADIDSIDGQVLAEQELHLTVISPADTSKAAAEETLLATKELLEAVPEHVPKFLMYDDQHLKPAIEITAGKQFWTDILDPAVWASGVLRATAIMTLRGIFIYLDPANADKTLEQMFEPNLVAVIGLSGLMTTFFQLSGNAYNNLLNSEDRKGRKVGALPSWVAIDVGYNTFWLGVTELISKFLNVGTIAAKGFDEIAATSFLNGTLGTLSGVYWGRYLEEKRANAYNRVAQNGGSLLANKALFEGLKILLAIFLTTPEYMNMIRMVEGGSMIMGLQAYIGLRLFYSREQLFNGVKAVPAFVKKVIDKSLVTGRAISLKTNSYFRVSLNSVKTMTKTVWSACRFLFPQPMQRGE